MSKKAMTRKQMSKKKISVKLNVGETAIVVNHELAMHIAETYDYLATEHQDEHSDSFREIADHIRFQANENHYNESDTEYEEW